MAGSPVRGLLYGVVTLVIVILLMSTIGLIGPWEFGLAVLVAGLVGAAVARRGGGRAKVQK